jgi:hypothetical protein
MHATPRRHRSIKKSLTDEPINRTNIPNPNTSALVFVFSIFFPPHYIVCVWPKPNDDEGAKELERCVR